ncbi:hypothetical protein DENIS_2649 [Desulfonema ishimotonii]|uniref:Uncharacterized protein n=2 Tax=Desulfonema ishimotonii TaxID=45657 RepID=A0A401FXI2_9BACT|nr:hypothetical protein DENIS_2649 [Desulfonema ishimotonii]
MNTILARMVNLSVGAMKAESLDKAANIIVNQMHTLVKNERAVLVPLTGKQRVFCISGDLEPSQDNPFSQAVHEVRKAFRGRPEPRVITSDTLPEGSKMPYSEKALEAMGGTSVLWAPLPHPGGESRYALWLERWKKKPWAEEEIKLLNHALVFFGYALGVPRTQKVKPTVKKRTFGLLAVLAFFFIMWLPIPSRVNAPVQVVPDHPYYVFAPFDGIVEDLAIQPGEKVRKGDLIFRYDTRVLEKQLEEAQRGGLAVALAELARLEGAGYADEEARARIPVQKLEVERKRAEVAFLKKQLALSEVRTDADGVVVLDDPDALIGASLQTGQLVLSIAEPDRTKLRVMVPVSDAGLLQEGASVMVRLDSDPLRSIDARVERVGFDVLMSDERIPSILVESVWDGKADVTPGQRGTARIEGTKTFLGMQLFRKPLMALRDLIGI